MSTGDSRLEEIAPSHLARVGYRRVGGGKNDGRRRWSSSNTGLTNTRHSQRPSLSGYQRGRPASHRNDDRRLDGGILTKTTTDAHATFGIRRIVLVGRGTTQSIKQVGVGWRPSAPQPVSPLLLWRSRTRCDNLTYSSAPCDPRRIAEPAIPGDRVPPFVRSEGRLPDG